MVLAGKIFRIREKTNLRSIAAKLKGYTVEETYKEENFKFKLLTEIQRLDMKEGSLEGVFSHDKVFHVSHRGNLTPIPKTTVAPFAFREHGEGILLTILEKKWQTNNIANVLSEMLFITAGFIVEARIPPENLRRYHEQNSEGTKVIFFNDVDIPNVRKLSLYGASLANARLYEDFLSHGNIWYVVVRSKKHDHIVGVTGNSIVIVFNRVEPSDFISYVADEIFPLIET